MVGRHAFGDDIRKTPCLGQKLSDLTVVRPDEGLFFLTSHGERISHFFQQPRMFRGNDVDRGMSHVMKQSCRVLDAVESRSRDIGNDGAGHGHKDRAACKILEEIGLDPTGKRGYDPHGLKELIGCSETQDDQRRHDAVDPASHSVIGGVGDFK